MLVELIGLAAAGTALAAATPDDEVRKRRMGIKLKLGRWKDLIDAGEAHLAAPLLTRMLFRQLQKMPDFKAGSIRTRRREPLVEGPYVLHDAGDKVFARLHADPYYLDLEIASPWMGVTGTMWIAIHMPGHTKTWPGIDPQMATLEAYSMTASYPDVVDAQYSEDTGVLESLDWASDDRQRIVTRKVETMLKRLEREGARRRLAFSLADRVEAKGVITAAGVQEIWRMPMHQLEELRDHLDNQGAP
jgi:hypothetical protein